MKILYLVNMREGNYGGLFKATYERLKRHKNKKYIININYYDQLIISIAKKVLFNKTINNKIKSEYQYKEFTIKNLNIARGIGYYINKIFTREEKNLNTILETFIEKNMEDLSEFDLIHVHWGYPNGYLAYQLGKKYDLPYVITFHGSDINNIHEAQKKYLLETMEKASRCFFVSNKLLENAKKIGYSGKNAMVTYNGVDTNEFLLSTKKIGKDKVVGYIGALEKIKGADFLPEIYKEIQKKYPDVSFIIIGDGALKESIKEEINENKIQVDFLGKLSFEEIPDYLSTIDVLIVPSRNEGLGMIILEAQAMGIPVVATNVGGISEAIVDDDNLIAYDEQLIEKITNRTVQILSNPTIDSLKYRERTVTKFSWERIVKIEELAYENIIYENNNYTKHK